MVHGKYTHMVWKLRNDGEHAVAKGFNRVRDACKTPETYSRMADGFPRGFQMTHKTAGHCAIDEPYMIDEIEIHHVFFKTVVKPINRSAKPGRAHAPHVHNRGPLQRDRGGNEQGNILRNDGDMRFRQPVVDMPRLDFCLQWHPNSPRRRKGVAWPAHASAKSEIDGRKKPKHQTRESTDCSTISGALIHGIHECSPFCCTSLEADRCRNTVCRHCTH
jgi:hypothetical protein